MFEPQFGNRFGNGYTDLPVPASHIDVSTPPPVKTEVIVNWSVIITPVIVILSLYALLK